MARVKTLSVNHPLAKELDKFPNFDKKSITELANQAYNNSLNKLGNYHKH